MSIDGLYIGQRRVRPSIQKIGRCGRCQRWGANVFSAKGWRHVKCVRLDESGALAKHPDRLSGAIRVALLIDRKGQI